MKDVEHINPVIEAARKQLELQRRRLTELPHIYSPEDFNILFLIRANQVMLEHGDMNLFTIDENNAETLKLLYYYATRTNKHLINPLVGIVLNGAFGCGKSILIAAFCRTLNDMRFCGKEKIYSIHAIELAEHIKLKGVIPFARIPLLIQDMGKEPDMINSFGNKTNPISDLLAIRAEYGSLTYGSTNMTPEEIMLKYHKFISKRFDEHVNRIFLPGGNRRPDYSRNQPK